ncbi:O-antigen/teichoic acid export membrane protein [Microbacterium sp. BE35]|uniref:lipopolysaccharide biosynthesis protein n=1 Tax=Microbacterium sp. BE35 TaxID=2817773 RepID=UPI00285BD403|nr:lipopolysaccharide biosynthesis protein [Microbacterium sp. BE35]MDR7188706.1 O-antigen/teichoic acid export membrane protein [Microbacterium sp. BE35]
MTDDLRRRTVSSIGWVVLERWSVRLLSLLVLVILSRVLSPADFGLVALATSATALLQVVSDSGFSRALIQRRRLDPADASTAFWASMVLAIVLAAVLVLTAPLIALALSSPGLTPILQILSIGLPLSALSQVPAALLERDLDFKPLSFRQFIGALCGALVSVPLALIGWGVWALVAQTLVASAAAVIALWTSTSWRPRWEFSWQSFRNLWAVGGAILGVDLMDAVQANIDKIVIGVLFSPTELGYYFLAQRLGTILIELVTSVVSRVSLTTFSRVQDDRPRLNRIFRQLTFAASAVSVGVFGLVAVLAPQLIPTLFGSGWDAAVPIIWVLAPGWAIGAVMYFDRNALLATGNARSALWLALLQNVVSIIMVFVFAPFGVIGIAFSRLARFVVWPVRLIVLRRAIGLRVWRYLLQIIRCVAASVVPFGAVALLQLTPWADTERAFFAFALPLAAAAGIIYAGLLWAVAGTENRLVIRSIVSVVTARARRRSS